MTYIPKIQFVALDREPNLENENEITIKTSLSERYNVPIENIELDLNGENPMSIIRYF